MLQDLDPNLINALEELRREFDDKLSLQRKELERLLGSTSEQAEPELEPEPMVAAEPRPALELDLLEELKLASTEIDSAESQADVLDALIRGAARFASRTAVFLVRDGALHGWGGTGFGQADSSIKDMTFEAPEGSPWEQITAGKGGICLTSADCSILLDKLDADKADIGVLVPFVLRQQVAAVVYSDRSEQAQTFNISGLQLLSFLAGLTVETLPIRERSATNSLQLAVAPAPIEEAPVEEAPVEEPPAEEVPLAEAPADEVLPPSPAETEAVEMEAEITEQIAEQPAYEIPAAEEWGPAPTAAPPVEAPAEILASAEAEPLPEEPPEPDISAMDAAFDISTVETPPEEPVAPAIETEIAPQEPAAEEAAPPEIPAPAEGPPPEPAEPPSLSSTQVQPPQDVEGPGWAFTTTRIPTSAGTEALHEEARRLARLLVTEIKLYNEELVEEGRQAGDVYSRLREDIDRSRQIFDDRIDSEVRSEKNYFREALVRILAGGDPSVLGISD